jgi:hypothetical protein
MLTSQSHPTDLSRKLRSMCAFGPHDFKLLTKAADEIERYYGGMLNWKKTAEEKDAALFKAQAAVGATFPAELTPGLQEILGMPNFSCAAFAESYRRGGYAIAYKSEQEQAFVLHRLVTLYLADSVNWGLNFRSELIANHRHPEPSE